MSKVLRFLTILAVLAIFTLPKQSNAAGLAAPTAWGAAVTITHGDLGALPAATTTSFTASSGVAMYYMVDPTPNFFVVTSQHQRGSEQYGMHNNGGALYLNTAATVIGAWNAAGTIAVATVTAVPLVAFPAAGWRAL
ncbi:MAG: hypothetical protein ABIJ24_03885 [Nitrospinota bacterium]